MEFSIGILDAVIIAIGIPFLIMVSVGNFKQLLNAKKDVRLLDIELKRHIESSEKNTKDIKEIKTTIKNKKLKG